MRLRYNVYYLQHEHSSPKEQQQCPMGIEGVRGPFVLVAAFVIWDLVMKFMYGPTENFFFPRLPPGVAGFIIYNWVQEETWLNRRYA